MWLYLPPSVLPFVPGPEAWNWDCISQTHPIALFVSLSAGPSLRPLSWPGWRTRPWMTRLSGLTFAPSTLARGVASWISSLRATRASPSAARAKSWGAPIRATSGPMFAGSSTNVAPEGSFLKTSSAMFCAVSTASSATFKTWASGLLRACSQRLKSAHRTNASASSFWPTPTVATNGSRPDLTLGEGPVFRKRTFQFCTEAAVQVWCALWEMLTILGVARIAAISRSSPPVHLTLEYGRRCSTRTRTCSPEWLDWMMGWPPGWTDPTSPVTGFARWQQHMRTALSTLPSAVPEAA